MKETLNQNAQAVLNIVRTTKHHPTALEIYEAVKQTRPRIGMASVYRILHSLAEQGFIKELGDDSCRYDGLITRHDHALCTQCGTLLDLPRNVTVSLDSLQEAAQSIGLQLETHGVFLFGRCLSCQHIQLPQG